MYNLFLRKKTTTENQLGKKHAQKLVCTTKLTYAKMIVPVFAFKSASGLWLAYKR